jgi:hypothetical protein
MEGYEPTPAIVRAVSEKDGDLKPPTVNGSPDVRKSDNIISQPKTTVSHHRGRGSSGFRIQVVEHDCPECDFDRMVRRVDVNPTYEDEVRYWCLNPNCVHFVRDMFSYACHGNYPQRDTSEPAVFEGKGD